MSEWRVLLDGPRPAAAQMTFDERLICLGVPTVRFFTWHPPAVSFGFKQIPPEWLAPSQWSAQGLELVERPTGGGMAFHGSDVSLSVVVPRDPPVPLELIMRTVCQSAVRVCRAFGAEAHALMEPHGYARGTSIPPGPPLVIAGAGTAHGGRHPAHANDASPTTMAVAPGGVDVQTEGRITYCLTQPSPYAVLIGARKVAGFAVRRYPDGWLVQGSLLVRRLPGLLARALPSDLLQRVEREASPLCLFGGVSEREIARHWADRWVAWWETQITADRYTESVAIRV